MKYYLYYLYHAENNKQTYCQLLKIFADKKHLLDFLAFHQDYRGAYFASDIRKTVYRNEYLDNLNMNGNDDKMSWTSPIPYRASESYYSLREYMFTDDNDCIIDIRYWYQDIIKNASPNGHFFSYDYYEKYKLTKDRHQCRHRHTDYAYRRLRYKHIIKDRHDKENAPYIRKKAANRLEYECLGIRSISGSWKDQSKRKHQWKEIP